MTEIKVIKFREGKPEIISIPKDDFKAIQAEVGGSFEVYDVLWKGVSCQAFCHEYRQDGHPTTFPLDTESSPYMRTLYSQVPEEERVVTLYGDIILANHDENGSMINCMAI